VVEFLHAFLLGEEVEVAHLIEFDHQFFLHIEDLVLQLLNVLEVQFGRFLFVERIDR